MSDIVLHALYKAFDHPVLTGFSATLHPGSIYAMMGPSGSGKTTLLRLIAGLERPDSGTVTGIETGRISMMFQEDRLLKYLSAVDNVRFALPQMRAEDIISLFEKLGIARVDCLRPVREYSGGMKRRVAFLRAVCADSDLLLLDEPFKGLDEATADLAIRFLLKNKNGRIVLFSTHNQEEAHKCGAKILDFPLTPLRQQNRPL